jgi:hypothetical protein
MLPEHIPNAPAMTGGYAPYFYASGLYRLHALPDGHAPHVPPSERPSLYDFTSDLVRKSRPDHPQTVEDVIRRGYLSVPQAEPESAAISDKAETSWLGLDDIIGQVRHRHDIYRQNLYEIELAKCYVMSSHFGMLAERGNVPADSRETYSLTKRLSELYENQRDERVRFWQDVSRLRQSLPEVARYYLGAYRKLSILKDEDGDGP